MNDSWSQLKERKRGLGISDEVGEIVSLPFGCEDKNDQEIDNEEVQDN